MKDKAADQFLFGFERLKEIPDRFIELQAYYALLKFELQTNSSK